MTEQQVRKIIREELQEMAGGPWENIREMVRIASEQGLVQDIGTKRSSGKKTHEFAIAGRIYEIKELEE